MFLFLSSLGCSATRTVFFNASYICMDTCALFHQPLGFAAHVLKGKIIEYSGSVISTALVRGVTGCALGMLLAGEIK